MTDRVRQPAEEPKVDVSLIPPHVGRITGAATVEVARRIQRKDPEMRAKIKARAAEIRAERRNTTTESKFSECAHDKTFVSENRSKSHRILQ